MLDRLVPHAELLAEWQRLGRLFDSISGRLLHVPIDWSPESILLGW
jgi:hypothetical protein